MANESVQGTPPATVFGVVVQGQYVSARVREWVSKSTGEKGSSTEVVLVLEDGGEPVALDVDEKLVRQAKTSLRLGETVRLRCTIGSMSRIRGMEFVK